MEVLATFISVDSARDLVTMGELGEYREAHEVVLPKCSKELKMQW